MYTEAIEISVPLNNVGRFAEFLKAREDDFSGLEQDNSPNSRLYVPYGAMSSLLTFQNAVSRTSAPVSPNRIPQCVAWDYPACFCRIIPTSHWQLQHRLTFPKEVAGLSCLGLCISE